MMTEQQLDALRRARLLPWQRLAVKLVSGKLADARAHAEKAVTEALKSTPDGRASAAVIRRNPSYKAAEARLDELLADIGGPSVTSISGLVQDCTEGCYRDAMRAWLREVPDDMRAAGNPPTSAQLAYVRGLLWHGLPIRSSFAGPITRARHDLAAAVGMAGSIDGRDSSAMRTWETQHRARLIRYLGLALGDADGRANDQAMRDAIDPRYLTAEAKR